MWSKQPPKNAETLFSVAVHRKKTLAKSSTRSRNLDKYQETRNNPIKPILSRSGKFVLLAKNLPQWHIISTKFVRSFLRRHFEWKSVVTSRRCRLFSYIRNGWLFVFFFLDRRMRRQRLERKRKRSKKVSSNVFLWVFTLTSGSRKRLCFVESKTWEKPWAGMFKAGLR